MSKHPEVSISVVRRLPKYYRFLKGLIDKGIERISSREFADLMGVTASQIRQDLNCFGGFGQQGYGYNVKKLHDEIGYILALNKPKQTILIGAGNLGIALANHIYFQDFGFQLVGIFDRNPEKSGMTLAGVEIQPTKDIAAFCKEHKPTIAILCVPKIVVQEIATELAELGIQGFWNFSQYDISLDIATNVVVENVHLGDSLMTLGFLVEEHNAKGE